MLKKILFSKKDKERKLEEVIMPAEKIAQEAGVLYIPDSVKKVGLGYGSQKLYVEQNKYISFMPLYTFYEGHAITQERKWYYKFGRGKSKRVRKVLDNSENFSSSITNLNEIIKEMLRIYIKYIDAPIAILPFNFALKLKERVKPRYYKGEAELVITPRTIMSINEESIIDIETKKIYIKDFLNNFLLYNFMNVIKEDINIRNQLVVVYIMLSHRGIIEEKEAIKNLESIMKK